MNSSLLWIVLPFVFGLALLPFRRQRGLVLWSAAAVCFLLVFLAWLVPIGTILRIGPLSILVSSEWVILGRRFVLGSADRSILILMYLFSGIWFLGARQADTPAYFPAIGLTMIALLVAAQAVEPFLYAALILELAVLLSLPLLNPPGRPAGSGVMRYLIFQTLAIPFILMAGWAAGLVEANPPGTQWVLQAVLFLGLGFAFWLAVFPFYTWVPLVAQQASPYVIGFLLGLLPVGVLWLALSFLDTFTWLRTNSLVADGLRLSGGLMVLTAGLWAAFQTDLARVLGYAILLENGYALLAISLRSSLGMDLFAAAIIPRLVAIAVWSLSLSVLQKNGITTTLQGLTGILRRYPIAGIALALAYFSLGGMPLLASFPVRQPLLETLAGASLPVTVAVVVGNMGFLLGAYRLLTALVRSDEKDWKLGETWIATAMLLAGILLLLLAGMLPGVFLRGSTGLVQGFTHLR